MKFRNIVDFYVEKGLGAQKGEEARQVVLNMDRWLSEKGRDLKDADIPMVQEYLNHLICKKMNTKSTLYALARFFYISNTGSLYKEIYRHFTAVLGRQDLYDAISERIERLEGKELRDKVFKGVTAPPDGARPDTALEPTALLMKQLKQNLPKEKCRHTLAGNAHRIPKEAFKDEPARLQQAGTLDHYLKEFHERQIATLTHHVETGEVWFEQVITSEVVDYVRSNQEVLGGIRKGNKIYITKIPYVPAQWVKETDPQKKRYLACHCPLAREAVKDNSRKIPRDWCYCSGGFAKFRFDVLFNQETEVELIETVLDGGDVCRFAVTIPDEYLGSL